MTIRVVLPYHLRTLARIEEGDEVALEIGAPPTLRAVLDVLESRYPVLRGTIREHGTLRRRAFVRFYACGEDLSHESPESEVPPPVALGQEPLMIIGAMAGG